MTEDLQERWRQRHQPFDGDAVVSCDEPDLTVLRDVLRLAIEHLKPAYPDLLTYRDWHEHDGFITASAPATWHSLESAIQDRKSLYDSRDGDDYVRVAYFPASSEWLLRYNIDDLASPEWINASCAFDFSCSPSSRAAGLIRSINDAFPGYCDVLRACDYFDNAYGS